MCSSNPQKIVLNTSNDKIIPNKNFPDSLWYIAKYDMYVFIYLYLCIYIAIPCLQRQRTPLHVASWKGHIEAVKTLVELGADMSMTDVVSKKISA